MNTLLAPANSQPIFEGGGAWAELPESVESTRLLAIYPVMPESPEYYGGARLGYLLHEHQRYYGTDTGYLSFEESSQLWEDIRAITFDHQETYVGSSAFPNPINMPNNPSEFTRLIGRQFAERSHWGSHHLLVIGPASLLAPSQGLSGALETDIPDTDETSQLHPIAQEFSLGVYGASPTTGATKMIDRIIRALIEKTDDAEYSVDDDGALSFEATLSDGSFIMCEVNIAGNINAGIYDGPDGDLKNFLARPGESALLGLIRG